MSRLLVIELPYPAKPLWSNGSHGHWAPLNKARKAARATARICAKEALGGHPWISPHASIQITLHPRSHKSNGARNTQTPDLDNIVSACKAQIDGIADALGINDRNFTLLPPQVGDRCQFGLLRVTVTQ